MWSYHGYMIYERLIEGRTFFTVTKDGRGRYVAPSFTSAKQWIDLQIEWNRIGSIDRPGGES